MSEQFIAAEEMMTQEEDIATSGETTVTEPVILAEENHATATVAKKLTKKKLIIGASCLIAIIAIAFIIFYPSKFERVKDECVQLAGMISGGKDYFTIDTFPDVYENMDEWLVAMLKDDAQEGALEAIRYANRELGFNGSVYNDMLKTTALMGRQHEENDKYEVSWTYHPDDGLEVTYEKK